MDPREIVKAIKGGGCKRLVKQIGNEIEVKGASFGFGDFKLDVGNVSNKIQQFYKVTQTTIALDNSQFLLCEEIDKLKDKPQLQEICIRMRLQLIFAFSQLQAIVGSMNEAPIEELEKELTEWVRKMSKLNEDSIEALNPTSMLNPEDKKKEITSIMEYQGIEEKEMQEALVNYESSLQTQQKDKVGLNAIRAETANNAILHDIRPKTSTSKRWLARELKNRLEKAYELERWATLQPSFIVSWLSDTEDFLEKSFGENSRYYQLFPKFMRPTANDMTGGILSYNEQFREAKEQLEDILQDIQEEIDNNNS